VKERRRKFSIANLITSRERRLFGLPDPRWNSPAFPQMATFMQMFNKHLGPQSEFAFDGAS
jgi:hypothetical protein